MESAGVMSSEGYHPGKLDLQNFQTQGQGPSKSHKAQARARTPRAQLGRRYSATPQGSGSGVVYMWRLRFLLLASGTSGLKKFGLKSG